MFEKIKAHFKDAKKRKQTLMVMLLIFLIGGYIGYSQITKPEQEDQSITAFVNFIKTDEAKKMEEVTVYDQDSKLTYQLNKVVVTVDYPKSFLTENNETLDRLAELKIDVAFEKGLGSSMMIFFEFFRIAIFILLFVYIFRMMGDSFLTPTLSEVEGETVTFKDIAGYEYVKEELVEIIDFLNDPKAFEKYTQKMPKGVLLEGPPGNGKTMFAKAVAGESKTPFFQISGADIEDKYVGSGARRVEKIFKTVRKKAEESGKVILFIDEIDAVGMKRESRTVQETNQTINKLLTEMDGFEKDTKVVIIAATNLSIMLDSALTRSGRFDRIISIERPTMEEREAVINLYLNKKGVLIDEEVYRENYAHVLAQQTEGFSNADLDKLVNEASLIAKKKNAEKMDIRTLREGFTKIVAGVKTNRKVSDEDKRVVSYHEAGHAVAQIMTSTKGYKGVAYITVTPHGQSLGHVSPISEERLARKSDIENRIVVALAGRVVEEVILDGDFTVGAANDLQQANQLLLGYVAKYGMSVNNQNLYVENLDENKELIQKEIKYVRENLYELTKQLIATHFDMVEKIAQRLMEEPSLEQHDLPELLKGTSYEQNFLLKDTKAE